MSATGDPIKPWFDVLEEMGEYTGIRFGQVDEKSGCVDWHDLPHSDYDGIGGFAKLLRDRGAAECELPKIPHSAKEGWGSFIKSIPSLLAPRRRLKLNAGTKRGEMCNTEPPSAVGWHVFSESETILVRKAARYYGVSVNSMLLRHLDKAIRKSLDDPSVTMPWMVPVNLRGKIIRSDDTANHSSYIGIKLRPTSSFVDVHRKIYQRLNQGQHWANWKSYALGSMMSKKLKKKLVAKDRATSQWNVGGFSNLGVWDSREEISRDACPGPWLFSPPVLECQRIGAGCVTFQNRLSLMIQAHPLLTIDSSVTQRWMEDWVNHIRIDLAVPRRD